MSHPSVISFKPPQVEQLLQRPIISCYQSRLSRSIVTDVIRQLLAQARHNRYADIANLEQLEQLIVQGCEQRLQQRLQRVINATGTALHTNLGRAPIDAAVWQAVTEINTHYNNLELNLADGQRGQRKGLLPQLFTALVGAEDCTVVNNNAASIYLLLHSLANGKEVIVSRGEQIQIGGGFRIPDILALSGATLVEVGTTNITTADDYLNAISDNTAMVLMVHQSNFAIQGFTESPDIKQVAKGLPQGIILAVDQGSGMTTERFAAEEASVASYLSSGADLVCFSGDKILGGPQAGILCGRKELIKRIERHPLMRTFRPSKIVHSLLEELLIRKLNKDVSGSGVAAQKTEQVGLTEIRAQQLVERFPHRFKAVPMALMIGGGTLPIWQRQCWGVSISCQRPAVWLLQQLRQLPIPIIGTIQSQQVLLNMATIGDDEMETVIALLQQLDKQLLEAEV
ncbi:L-seryl-tRNA(Sec) selenium transferase [Ferrimonas lipolytica]|uniref:L-seryl-tRNA(Sec) selenium transferase n=1 Tax=Ferrimonas lipolytica TaxID=2724191 RepID=A0A6H1UB01_9GAMM|nr:L-seryl-tRNA(Sec) selenium transferase [Ferrimonas lipolytica]QIZ76245.1 L-seryl-tRNA(Sec) selenium transferase [Ferrimonas lipolytica]